MTAKFHTRGRDPWTVPPQTPRQAALKRGPVSPAPQRRGWLDRIMGR